MFARVVKAQKAPVKTMFRAVSTESLSAAADTDFAVAATKYPAAQVSSLNNGLRVATEHCPGEMATVGVFINTGSRYETAKNNGVAHFLEHMLFKGTSKRTRVNLEKEIENMGGQLNAYTSREQTVFYAKVFKNDVNQAVDILGDILLNSNISPGAIERERGVILREMEDVDSRLQEVVFDRLHQTAYRGSSLARTILGPEENIQSITREDIDTYIKSHYTAPRMVVAAAGDIDHSAFVKQTEKLFAHVPSTPVNGIEPKIEKAHFIGSEIRIRDDDMPLAHVAYGFETAGWTDPDHYPLMVLQMMVGNYTAGNSGNKFSTSPLIQSIAAENAAESLTPFNTVYSDTGLFGFYAVADAMCLDSLSYSMAASLSRYAHNCNNLHLDEAKHKLALMLFSQFEGSTAICEDLGRQMLNYNRRIHPVEMVHRISSVTVDDIKRVANRFFYDQDPAVAAIGPIYELPDYAGIRSRTYSFFN